jgi:hypothetical protein
MVSKFVHAKRREDVLYALDHGWEYTGIARGHLQFEHPDTKIRLKLPGTPGSSRCGMKNTIAQIRKLTPEGARTCGTS